MNQSLSHYTPQNESRARQQADVRLERSHPESERCHSLHCTPQNESRARQQADVRLERSHHMNKINCDERRRSRHYIRSLTVAALMVLALALTGCPRTEKTGAPAATDAGHTDGEPAATPTNRIPIPDSVRQNLGITFVKVVRRRVVSTLRYPGQFEFTPDAWTAYHARLGGPLTLNVKQFQRVTAGDLLATVETPEWRESRHEISEATLALGKAGTDLAVAKADRAEAAKTAELAAKREATIPERVSAVQAHRSGLRISIEVWRARESELVKLAETGAGMSTPLAEARAALAEVRTQLLETEEELAELAHEKAGYQLEAQAMLAKLPALDARIEAATVAVQAASEHLHMTFDSAATRIGQTAKWLKEMVPGDDGKSLPRWHMIRDIEIRASRTGIVHELLAMTGEWLEPGQAVLRTLDPTALRFRASGLQADLPQLKDDTKVLVVPPPGSRDQFSSSVPGTLMLGMEADAFERTVDLLVTPDPLEGEAKLPVWARNGVSAQLEVVVRGNDDPVMAIPVRAVVEDGTERIYFRRDPADPDKVIRMVADLGVSDGTWVEVASGVRVDDEIVLDGVYPLKLSGAGKAAQGGHFHADGTFHAGPDH